MRSTVPPHFVALLVLSVAGAVVGCRAPEPSAPHPSAAEPPTVASSATVMPDASAKSSPACSEERSMKPVTVINRLVIKPGKIDEFIELQRGFATALADKPCGLLGGRMYRSLDGTSAVLVSQFASASAQEEIRRSDAFKQHVARLQDLIESSSPGPYEEAYSTGDFR